MGGRPPAETVTAEGRLGEGAGKVVENCTEWFEEPPSDPPIPPPPDPPPPFRDKPDMPSNPRLLLPKDGGVGPKGTLTLVASNDIEEAKGSGRIEEVEGAGKLLGGKMPPRLLLPLPLPPGAFRGREVGAGRGSDTSSGSKDSNEKDPGASASAAENDLACWLMRSCCWEREMAEGGKVGAV